MVGRGPFLDTGVEEREELHSADLKQPHPSHPAMGMQSNGGGRSK